MTVLATNSGYSVENLIWAAKETGSNFVADLLAFLRKEKPKRIWIEAEFRTN